jgi:periplasmic divalent cation tolerance protein
MTNKRLVLSTAGTKEEAQKIAHALVEQQLAACVNIVPQMQSVYRWQGKVEEAEEFLLLIKTSAERFAKVSAALRELHSYEVPECVSVAIDDGSADYLKWLAESVG